MSLSRRSFSLAMYGAVAAAPQVLGANDRIHVGIVGLGGRGKDHVDFLLPMANCRVAALCDVDSARLEREETRVGNETGTKPAAYRDMRQIFDDKEIDAVTLVTPNHWHALATIWACQAGKDVYSEKPACHNIFEGRRMVDAARKYKRVVQIGHQSRSVGHKREAIALLNDGIIGKVYMAKGLCFKRRLSIGRKPDGPVPPGVDFDKWLGPAPMRAFNPNRFHYNWHWFWDTGNGDIGNQGAHEMDIALWGLGGELPDNVVSTGGKYVYDDDQETPNTQLATYNYGDREIVFEVRGVITGGEAGMRPQGKETVNTIGNLFLGADGWMEVDAKGYKVYKGENHQLVKESGIHEKREHDTAPHFQNWLDACHSRRAEDLHCDVEVGVRAATLCHMANVSYRVGRSLKYDPKRHWFADADANRLATREYRKPYVVPEKV
ncbi:MAG TPA: Gfo/Idh/MocA family oxidoreductase [Bryobacteraceae bacterium]|nr:Gfo/Idh/MocA family oxidoreductase [Bryobacteraceae bacterium]